MTILVAERAVLDATAQAELTSPRKAMPPSGRGESLKVTLRWLSTNPTEQQRACALSHRLWLPCRAMARLSALTRRAKRLCGAHVEWDAGINLGIEIWIELRAFGIGGGGMVCMVRHPHHCSLGAEWMGMWLIWRQILPDMCVAASRVIYLLKHRDFKSQWNRCACVCNKLLSAFCGIESCRQWVSDLSKWTITAYTLTYIDTCAVR